MQGNASPLPRPRVLTERFLRLAFASGIAVLLLIGAWVAFVAYSAASSEPRSSRGNTPLGPTLAVSPGAATCAAGNATAAWNCSYTFRLAMLPTNGVPPLDLESLNFEIVKSDGAISGAPFKVTVIDPTGCALGAYNSTINSWGPSVHPATCGPSYSNTTRIESGDAFAVSTIPLGGLPFSGVGDQLQVIGVDEFSGSVGAYFP